VPESLYPKAAAVLRDAETALGITHRCHDYARYVYRHIRAGEAFDADEIVLSLAACETRLLRLEEIS
jgi:hypothetical protein